jgi:hypothetical protein
MEHTPRAARYAFTAAQAIAVCNCSAQPGITANVDLDWAIIGADAALDTAGRVRHDIGQDQRLVTALLLHAQAFQHGWIFTIWDWFGVNKNTPGLDLRLIKNIR